MVNDPPPGGNNNGRFDPGETGRLIISLRNAGNQPATNVTTKLRSGDSRFVLSDSLSAYGTIPACSTRTGDEFVATADPSIPPETPIQLTLFVFGDSYCDTLTFRIVVGEFRQCDPIPDGPRQPPLYWAYDDVDTLYRQHPQFSWVEINGIGTRLQLSDDQTVQIDLPSGFIWQYYGQQYTQLSICSNGWVAPGYSNITSYSNTSLPNSGMPPFIGLCWDDLYPLVGNGVWYYHDAANRRFIIEYDSVRYYSSTVQDKFELIIYDQTSAPPSGDNVLLAQYLTANGFTSATVGMQDPTATIAIQCLFDNVYHRGTAPLAAGRAIRYLAADPTALLEQPGLSSQGSRTLRAMPNPFPGSTTIRLGTVCRQATTLVITDVAGRTVRTLPLAAGTAAVDWNGQDESGRRVAPGIYFCRFDGSSDVGAKLILER